jgi:hypothetical protein
MERFTLIHDEDGIQVFSFDGASIDVQALLEPISTLSTDAPPTGTDTVVYANTPAYKWGRTAFLTGGFFCKAFYTCRHLDRGQPLDGVARLLANHVRCMDLGLPVPQLLGAFAREVNGDWLWNGVVAQALGEGWRPLNAASESDTALLRRAEAAFTAKGLVTLEMSPSNVMTDGDTFKVVDLDWLAPLPTTCTKYELVTALQTLAPELLGTLRSAYAQSSELQFYWSSVQELDRNNADFARLAQAVGATDAQLNEIFIAIAKTKTRR